MTANFPILRERERERCWIVWDINFHLTVYINKFIPNTHNIICVHFISYICLKLEVFAQLFLVLATIFNNSNYLKVFGNNIQSG